MAFLQGIIPGKAKELHIGGRKEEDVYLELNLKEGVISAYISRLEPFPSKIHRKLSKEKNISLKEIEFFLPAGKLIAKSIDKLFITSYALGGYSAEERPILNILGLLAAFSNKDTIYGYEKLEFIPSNGKISFKLNKKLNFTEVVFANWNLFLPPLDYRKIIENFGIIITPAPSAKLITVDLEKNQENLDDFVKGIKLALSYLQGNTLYLFVKLKSENIDIYLSPIKKDNKTFLLVPIHSEEINYVDEFLYSMMKYWQSINSKEKSKLEMIIYNLIFAKTGDAYIEIKILTLLNTIEIIIGEKLSKDTLNIITKELSISDYDAKFILKLKDELFLGNNLLEAWKKTFDELWDTKENNSVFLKIKNLQSKLSDIEISLNILYAFVKILDLYILNKIGYKGRYLDPLNNFKEIYVKKILAEDKDLLEELKKR